MVKGITKIWEIIKAGVNINKEYPGISLANFSSLKNKLFILEKKLTEYYIFLPHFVQNLFPFCSEPQPKQLLLLLLNPIGSLET